MKRHHRLFGARSLAWFALLLAACGDDGTVSRGDAGPRRDGSGGGNDSGGGPRCGDGDTTAGEECDDGNNTSGDGCSDGCLLETPTAYRLNSLALVSPRIVVDIPLEGCTDLTQNGTSVLGMDIDSINSGLDANVSEPDGSGRYETNIVLVFRPVLPAAPSTTLDILDVGMMGCMAGSPTSCMLAAPSTEPPNRANNMQSGTCFTPTAADVNTRTGTPAAYSPTANSATGPCFASDETTYPVSVSGTIIPLTHARISGTYSGSPPNALMSGTIIGFLSEAQARSTNLPESLPVVGGMPFITVLQAGGADGSACNVDGGPAEDDRDADPDSPSTQGFWFFLNFTAEQVAWTEP
jgi:cysteine-rich repeat protein